MNWTEDQVLAMAPDQASVAAGKAQAKAEKWLTLHYNEKAIWGEIKGSGKNPYQAVIDTTQIAFKCSCPSRKFPCKHGLGLALVHARSSEKFQIKDAPDWVEQWLSKREQKEENKKEKKDKPVDEKAQVKRAEARLEKVHAGLEEVSLWLQDLIRQGLAQVPEKAHTFWQSAAARMVDAQASGVANMIKALDQINYYGHSWQMDLLRQLSRIFLLVKGFKNIEQLPKDLQEDIRSMIGWSVQKDELKQQEEGIRDQWFVLGQETEKEERLTIQRVWLYGQQSKKYALIINFYAPGQLPDFAWMAGMTYEATLVFYPGRQSLRALVKEQHPQTNKVWPGGLTSLTELENYLTERLTAFPWTAQMPVLLEGMTPCKQDTHFVLLDNAHKTLPLATTFQHSWLLMALSGGKPLQISGMYQEGNLLPMGIWHEDKFIVLSNA